MLMPEKPKCAHLQLRVVTGFTLLGVPRESLSNLISEPIAHRRELELHASCRNRLVYRAPRERGCSRRSRWSERGALMHTRYKSGAAEVFPSQTAMRYFLTVEWANNRNNSNDSHS
jgi:hypothetical protein